jgi:hypothetical protein
MTRTFRLLLLLPLLLAVAAGCHSRMGRLHGTVKYKGQPLPSGTITFHTQEGGIYTYGINAEGKYQGTEVAPGDYLVTVETGSADPNKKNPTYGQGGGAKRAGGDPNDYRKMMQEHGAPIAAANTSTGSFVKIPDKYADKKTSGLTATITGGSNQKDFDLTD